MYQRQTVHWNLIAGRHDAQGCLWEKVSTEARNDQNLSFPFGAWNQFYCAFDSDSAVDLRVKKIYADDLPSSSTAKGGI